MSAWEDLVTFLPTADLARADRFYAGVLGLPLMVDQGTCRIYRVAQGASIGVCAHLEPTPASGVITTLVTDDVDGWHAALEEAGADVEAPPQHNERFGIYHFFVLDPDGNRLEVQRFEREPG